MINKLMTENLILTLPNPADLSAIKDLWLPLCRHFSLMSCSENGDIKEQDIANFRKNGIIDLLHPRISSFGQHKANLAKLLNQVLDPKTPVEKLHEIIRTFEYRSLLVPFYKRGSKAITESIVEGFKRAFAPDYCAKNYEAFAEPYLSNYIKL